MHNDNSTEKRADFYRRIRQQHLTPLWEALHSLVPAQPAGGCQAALWRYRELRPFLLEAGDLISAEEAVRRVLVLENPDLPGQSSITPSLYAGLQLILPGEIAPATGTPSRPCASSSRATAPTPRWTANAPAWSRATSSSPRPGPGTTTATAPPRKAASRWSGWTAWTSRCCVSSAPPSPKTMMNRYSRCDVAKATASPATAATCCRCAISRRRRPRRCSATPTRAAARPSSAWRASNGPIPGRPQAALCQPGHRRLGHADHRHLPATAAGRLPRAAARSTDASVYSVVEGSGVAQIGGRRFAFEAKDLFVVPSWAELRLEAGATDCVLFSFSDRPVQQALGILRESREPSPTEGPVP